LDGVRRGDLVTVALQGDQGKPRPALVVQADHFEDLASVTVLPITSTLVDAPLLRVPIEPGGQNGLARRSQIMVDKPQTPGRNKLGPVIGRLDDATMMTVNRVLAVFLGLA
jgi:mRNA interferase MazF